MNIRIVNCFRSNVRRIAVTFFLLSLSSWSLADDSRWNELKISVFGDRTVVADSPLIGIEAPSRAHDAATVPITIFSLDPSQNIKKVHLLVDKNPAPVAGVFTFEAAARDWRSFETRIRINEYTHVRAIGELEDGSLHMASSFVKAAGGCSAPAMADMEAALTRAGKMKLFLDDVDKSSGQIPLQSAIIKISHPNNSGMQFDQVSRNYIPAFYVHTIVAELNGKPLIKVDTNFSMSENPIVRVDFESKTVAQGELSVYAIDSKGDKYEKTATIAAAAN